ncbi:hypothetical protein ACSSV4_003274 [Roseovarius sp. MBR-154]|jgi:hypothetical protein
MAAITVAARAQIFAKQAPFWTTQPPEEKYSGLNA